MIKAGVDIRKMNPVWGIAYPMIQHVFASRGYPCIITSANDGRHGQNSLHYKGAALDIRSKHLPDTVKKPILDAMRAELGPQFDILLESLGKDNEHYHVEFDPKEPERSEQV